MDIDVKKLEELRALEAGELNKEIARLQDAVRQHKLDLRLGEATQVHGLGVLKKSLAQALTIRTERATVSQSDAA